MSHGYLKDKAIHEELLGGSLKFSQAILSFLSKVKV